MAYRLTTEQIHDNYQKFIQLIKDEFPTRADKLIEMYDSFHEDWILQPASYKEHFHNAIPGGYIDHVLRVIKFAVKTYNHWKDLGFTSMLDFTREELLFAAMHHDLGKLGHPGPEENLTYQANTDKWQREKQGQYYNISKNIPFMLVTDRGLFLLQSYGIPVTIREYLGIKLHDGLYEEGNKPYYIGYKPESKLRTGLPFVLSQADHCASLLEYEMWNNEENKVTMNLPFSDISNIEKENKKVQDSSTNEFDAIFGG